MRLHKILATVAVVITGGVTVIGSGISAGAESSDTTAPTDTSMPTDTTIAADPVVAATSQFSLPLLGTTLIVDISTDPGGNLVDVALNPADGYTATKLKPNKVQFVNEEGTVKVRVKTKHGQQKIDARAASLADVSGPGVWTGDVFGSGEPTTVNFTVGATADGAPDVTGVTVTSPHEFTIGDTDYRTGDDGDASASVTVDFTADGQTRTLRIKAKVDTHDDHRDDQTADDGAAGETRAKLSIALSKIRGRQIPAGEAVGPHSWTGMLCDGTTATVDYSVGEDGAVSDVAATPEGAEVKTGDHGAKITFATGERISIGVKSVDGSMTVGVKTKIRCDASEPTVNTPIDPQADHGESDHDRGDKKSDTDHGRGDKKSDQGNDRGDKKSDQGDGSRSEKDHEKKDDSGQGHDDNRGD